MPMLKQRKGPAAAVTSGSCFAACPSAKVASPNASNESGLGLDTTDFHAQALIGKTVQSIRFVANFGLGILGDPTQGANQNDVLDYGFSGLRSSM